jgi:hypothetical protein
MSERATRPLNKDATKAADDDLYSKHEDDPRPNALYDEQGNRKPLSANDPDQTDLRKEWMDSYKANGGKVEPTDVAGAPAGQAVLPCGQKERVDPLITGDAIEIDLTDIPEPEAAPDEPAEDVTEQPEEEEPESPPVQPVEVAVTQKVKGQPGGGEPAPGDEIA